MNTRPHSAGREVPSPPPGAHTSSSSPRLRPRAAFRLRHPSSACLAARCDLARRRPVPGGPLSDSPTRRSSSSSTSSFTGWPRATACSRRSARGRSRCRRWSCRLRGWSAEKRSSGAPKRGTLAGRRRQTSPGQGRRRRARGPARPCRAPLGGVEERRPTRGRGGRSGRSRTGRCDRAANLAADSAVARPQAAGSRWPPPPAAPGTGSCRGRSRSRARPAAPRGCPAR